MAGQISNISGNGDSETLSVRIMEKKIKWPSFSKETGTNASSISIYEPRKSCLPSNFPIRKIKKAEPSAKGLLDHTDCLESSDTLGEE